MQTLAFGKTTSLPRDPHGYGMICGDVQHGTLFYDWGDFWAARPLFSFGTEVERLQPPQPKEQIAAYTKNGSA